MVLHSTASAIQYQQRATARFSFQLHFAAPRRDTISLFTPEGERRWAPGWNPVYANISDAQHPAAGTVFTTDEHQLHRVWIIDAYDLRAGIIRYTVFVPGKSVTRIELRVREQGSGSTAAVSYDRTALGPAADAEVAEFATHGANMRAEWQQAIDAALQP